MTVTGTWASPSHLHLEQGFDCGVQDLTHHPAQDVVRLFYGERRSGRAELVRGAARLYSAPARAPPARSADRAALEPAAAPRLSFDGLFELILPTIKDR